MKKALVHALLGLVLGTGFAQAASRDVMDNRIDVWKDAHKDGQKDWRRDKSRTGNYGQVLRGNGRPSDQIEDGVQLPASLKDEGVINVYEQPANAPGGAGFGWTAVFDAFDGGFPYQRTIGSFEDGPLVETPWVRNDPPPVNPLPN